MATITADGLWFTVPVPAFTGYDSVDFRGQGRGAQIKGSANGIPITLIRR